MIRRGLKNWVGGRISALQLDKVGYFHGEDPWGRVCSLSSLLGRSLSSCRAGGGWGHLWGAEGGREEPKLGYLVEIKDQQAG